MNDRFLAKTSALLALCAAALCSSNATAYSRGTTNRSVSGCIGIIPSCHNDTMSARSGAMVAIDGPTTLAAGERATYTLRIARTDMGTLAGAGLDVRVSGGGLRPNGADTRIESCELTHNALILPAMAGASEVRIPFDFIAPASSTTVTIQAAGNGVDGNGAQAGMPGQTGDQWGTTSVSVMITGTADAGGTCLPDPVDPAPDAAVDASDASDSASAIDGDPVDVASEGSVSADGTTATDAAADAGRPPPVPGCQCTVAHGTRSAPSALVWAAGVAIVLVSRARSKRRLAR